jgi:lysine 2,3-aminomutase
MDQPFAITETIAELIKADPGGPVARQFVPDAREHQVAAEERTDPIGDERFSPVKGIVHRYPDRVLLKPLLACPVYCRFCFRREVVGKKDSTLSAKELDAAFAYVEAHPEIWEVILTGGDPLALSPRRLAAILARLDAIPHVEVVRIHTRVPVVDPKRINAALLAALKIEKPVYVVIHCNHADEITAAARRGFARLADVGIPLLSQSVLLKGVNDDAKTLETLFRALVRNRVKPYYLHHADLARGTFHFRTPIAEGQALMAALRGRVSGLAQPTYVLDIPGGHGKVPVGPSYFEDGRVTDPHGCVHVYPPPSLSARVRGERVPREARRLRWVCPPH